MASGGFARPSDRSISFDRDAGVFDQLLQMGGDFGIDFFRRGRGNRHRLHVALLHRIPDRCPKRLVKVPHKPPGNPRVVAGVVGAEQLHQLHAVENLVRL